MRKAKRCLLRVFLQSFFKNFQINILLRSCLNFHALMLKRILLLICFSGIAVYSVKIYQLKDKISFSPSNTANPNSEVLHLQFYMESDQAELLDRCQRLFSPSTDRMALSAHPSQPQLATLSVEKDFKPEAMHSILELQKKLHAGGCLANPRSRFNFASTQSSTQSPTTSPR